MCSTRSTDPSAALGAALVGHPGVDMVSFTGGVTAGRAVLAACAPHLRPAVLELGGNDPAIVAPDLEPTEELAARLLEAAFTTSGQVCMAVKRLYVPAARLGGVAGRPGGRPRPDAWSATVSTTGSPWARCTPRRPWTGWRT